MAIHVQYPDGTRQWRPMVDHPRIYRAYDGITVAPHHDARRGGQIDLPAGSDILAQTPNSQVREWRRYRSVWGYWSIFCETEAGS